MEVKETETDSGRTHYMVDGSNYSNQSSLRNWL